VANNIAGILARLVNGLHLFSVFTYSDLLDELLPPDEYLIFHSMIFFGCI
jgi:hypothetical protein